jgi:hypothetical protein
MRWITPVILVPLVLMACEAKPHTLMAGNVPQATSGQIEDAFAGGEALPREFNDARSAAMLVATMPPLTDPQARMEIDLHAALYRAAHESNVGDFTRHFLLEPARDESSHELSMPDREFRLRVLAALASLNVPIAWAGPERQTSAPDQDFYPGTSDLATRLRIRIIQRIDEQATVLAEISDWTAHVGSSRQGVTATWDGAVWNLQRDPVRLFW